MAEAPAPTWQSVPVCLGVMYCVSWGLVTVEFPGGWAFPSPPSYLSTSCWSGISSLVSRCLRSRRPGHIYGLYLQSILQARIASPPHHPFLLVLFLAWALYIPVKRSQFWFPQGFVITMSQKSYKVRPELVIGEGTEERVLPAHSPWRRGARRLTASPPF